MVIFHSYVKLPEGAFLDLVTSEFWADRATGGATVVAWHRFSDSWRDFNDFLSASSASPIDWLQWLQWLQYLQLYQLCRCTSATAAASFEFRSKAQQSSILRHAAWHFCSLWFDRLTVWPLGQAPNLQFPPPWKAMFRCPFAQISQHCIKLPCFAHHNVSEAFSQFATSWFAVWSARYSNVFQLQSGAFKALASHCPQTALPHDAKAWFQDVSRHVAKRKRRKFLVTNL